MINEKGKLFGIINIIDLCVILILVLLVGAGGYKVLGKKLTTSPTVTSKEVTFVVKSTLRYPSIIAALNRQDKLLNLLNAASNTYGVSNNTYIDLVTSSPGDYTVTTEDGRVLIVKHPVLKDIFITIKTQLNPNASPFKLGIQDISIGKRFVIKTQTAEIDGTVESIQLP